MGEGERYTGGAFLFAAGCVAGWLWAIRPGLLADIEWFEVMTAFGTVGTAIAAVVIAGQTAQRESEKQRRLARIAAAELSIGLRPAIRQLRDAIEFLREAKNLYLLEPWAARGFISQAVEIIKRIELDVEPTHLVNICALDSETADRIAKAQGVLRNAKTLARSYSFTDDQMLTIDPSEFYKFGSQCENMRKWLNQAVRACSASSQQKYRISKEWSYSAKGASVTEASTPPLAPASHLECQTRPESPS